MSEKIISEATPVRIGLVILFLGAFGSGVWWAASINSKLDSIITSQQSTTGTITELKTSDAAKEKEINELVLRVTMLESKNPDSKK